MADLAEHEDRFKKNNLTLAVIGSGTSAHFEDFRRRTGYRGDLFTDPSLELFSALGFSKGLSGVLNLKSAARFLGALGQGHRQGPMQGSALQLGGALVMDPSGKELYRFAAARAGEHPDPADLLAAAGARPVDASPDETSFNAKAKGGAP